MACWHVQQVHTMTHTHTHNGVVAVRFGSNGFDCMCRKLNVNTKTILMLILLGAEREGASGAEHSVKEQTSEQAKLICVCMKLIQKS